MPFQCKDFNLISLVVEMALFGVFYSVLILQAALSLAMVYAQDDQSGFTSIDCGAEDSYTDEKTGIIYVSDEGFIESGTNQKIYSDNLDFQLKTYRSFPNNTRNCYKLTPEQGKGNKYSIRARFTFENYDSDKAPQFDLYLGNDYWSRVRVNESFRDDYEIIHLTSSDYIYVCLVDIHLGTPFISALELRLLDKTMYADDTRSLKLLRRRNFGSFETVRYADDIYDRIWYSKEASSGFTNVNTSIPVSLGSSTKEQVPSKVMSTAVEPTTRNLILSWPSKNGTEEYILYIHFAEIEQLGIDEIREFNIYHDRDKLAGPISPPDHSIITYNISIISSPYELEFNSTPISTLPPIVNAIEIYNPISLQQRQTEDQDATAMWNTKLAYGIKRNWQGDPCSSYDPLWDVWDGVICSNSNTDNPRIISIDLSSSGLSGEIAPALANLTMLQSLDLSYNSLSGSVPEFLGSLDSLTNLNLTGNHFTKPLPAELVEKARNGHLTLSIEADGDQDNNTGAASPKGSCKKNKVVTIGIVSVVAVFMLFGMGQP